MENRLLGAGRISPVHARHRRRRRIVEEAYFGTDGAPVRQKNGYAKLTHSYNAQGGLVEDAYFGLGGEPVVNENGYSRKVYIKDDRGIDIETEYFWK